MVTVDDKHYAFKYSVNVPSARIPGLLFHIPLPTMLADKYGLSGVLPEC